MGLPLAGQQMDQEGEVGSEETRWDTNKGALVVIDKEQGPHQADSPIVERDRAALGIGGLRITVDVVTPDDVMAGTLFAPVMPLD